MFGGGSIQLGRVFGIRIGVDISWFLVLFLIIWSLSGYYEDVAPGATSFVLATISAFLFFLSILLHEFGHAIVAIRNGIPIQGIDLWLFGGVAKLGRDSDSPGVEFRIAIAGPIVTLVIAALCLGAGALCATCSLWPSTVTQLFAQVPGSKFICGVPMNAATAIVCGRVNTSRGVPTCAICPSMKTARRSASVIASSWSWVT